MDTDNSGNYDAFRDCVFTTVVDKSSVPRRKPTRRDNGGKKKNVFPTAVRLSGHISTLDNNQTNPEELGDFSSYLATEIFSDLPVDLKTLSYDSLQEDSILSDKWSLPLTLSTIEEICTHISGTVTDSLVAYGLIEPPKSDLQTFMSALLSAYIPSVTVPPPKWIDTKKSACEICDRDWVPLTYHHLIPRQVHAKVLKRGWHDEKQLNSVAWLCRACHTFVHRMSSNEDLAKAFYSLDLICERDDVQKWAQWIGKVRWKKT